MANPRTETSRSSRSPSPADGTAAFRTRKQPKAPVTATRSQQPMLRMFLVHLATERGLAENTLLAYRRGWIS